jgi:phosphate transport system substrate-binding protein
MRNQNWHSFSLWLGTVLGVAVWMPAVVAQDLSALPDYEPEQQVSGVLRSWGTPRMGALLKQWQAGFRTYHPDTYFVDNLMGSSSAMMGLEEDKADMAVMGRQIVPYDTYGIWRRSHLLPVEIEVATGSVDVPGKSSAIAVLVHKDNPLLQLTLSQLDGIFGAQRTGGWVGMKWAPESGRSKEGNIRTWGQLGLKGEWADTPIKPLGPPGLYPGGMSYFQIRVMGGADTWNGDLMEYADREAMIAALEQDKYAIAYTSLGYMTEQVRAIALAESADGPFIAPTRASVASRAYPLTRQVFVYIAPDYMNGDPREEFEPGLKEFLRYVLSRQGQEQVLVEGDYLPLTDNVLEAQRQKLDEPPIRFKRLSP